MNSQAKILSLKPNAPPLTGKKGLLTAEDEKFLDLLAQAIAKHIISKAYEKRHPVSPHQQREAI